MPRYRENVSGGRRADVQTKCCGCRRRHPRPHRAASGEEVMTDARELADRLAAPHMNAARYETRMLTGNERDLIVTALRSAPPAQGADVRVALRLLQASSCFRGDVCSLLPCACAE